MDKSAENNKPIKNRKRFAKILNICIIVIAVIVLAIEGVLYYQRTYLTPFWVNGQSMYPTLNFNATDANGNKLDETSGNSGVGYTVDYGVMDTHKSAINKIKRFDIVVTKYKDGDTRNKIKRVIGLPGETVGFIRTGKDNEENGDLYINDVLIEQPIDISFVRSGDYYFKFASETKETITLEPGKYMEKVTLASNQYFVCGDNRGHSSDSREQGPVNKELITGKVVAICGTAEVYYDTDHFDVKNVDYKWPKKVK